MSQGMPELFQLKFFCINYLHFAGYILKDGTFLFKDLGPV